MGATVAAARVAGLGVGGEVVAAGGGAGIEKAGRHGWDAGRLAGRGAGRIVDDLAAAPVDCAPPGELRWSVVEAAQVTGLTAYDAAYLVLAVETGLELATCDRQLRAAAARAGVPCI